uniref:Butyrophilin subfamily 1 member A1 n=1 Tax=Pelodiscus sinensis TaxID=13735 RepID=K7FX31_PELSI
PVLGVVGQDVVLPCQLSPPSQLPSMDVQWRKIGRGFILVHEYMNEGTRNLPGKDYQNRTEMFLQEISRGNVSLKLKRIQMSDDGKYRCLVRNPEWTLESATDLQVAAVAPVFIDVLGPQGQGIGLACRSTGWSPKPKLQWVGKNRQNLTMESVTNVTKEMGNLYSVVSHVTVTEGEDPGDIGCIVQNSLVEMERQSAIHLSGDVFPRVSPWLAAFWALLALVLIAAGVCAYHEYTAKQIASKKKRSRETFLSQLGSSMAISPNSMNKRIVPSLQFRFHCYPELGRVNVMDNRTQEIVFRIPITLVQSCKHAQLILSPDGRTVQHKPAFQGPAASSEPLVAVGSQGFDDKGAGACRGYWEVEVGDSQEWELGVLNKTVREKVTHQRLEEFPKEGCWALGKLAGRYHPSEADTVIQSWDVKPTVVGVFLDLERGSLSFYSVNSMALILEIPETGSERWFPFLSPGHAIGQEQGKPLSICPP